MRSSSFWVSRTSWHENLFFCSLSFFLWLPLPLLTTVKGPWTSTACPSTDYFSVAVLYLYSKPWDLCLNLFIYFTGSQIIHLHVLSLSQFLYIKKKCIALPYPATFVPLLNFVNHTTTSPVNQASCCGQPITTSFVS